MKNIRTATSPKDSRLNTLSVEASMGSLVVRMMTRSKIAWIERVEDALIVARLPLGNRCRSLKI